MYSFVAFTCLYSKKLSCGCLDGYIFANYSLIKNYVG